MSDSEGNDPLCHKCKHSIMYSSCGSCVTAGIKKMEKIFGDSGVKLQQSEEDRERYLKYACQVVINCPSDFEVVKPFGDCPYFLHKALNLM